MNNTTGIGLVEAYDLDQPADSQLANISTRGFVETGSNVMIGGFILGNGTGTTNVLIRGIGLVGESGSYWRTRPIRPWNCTMPMAPWCRAMTTGRTRQQAEIEATGIPPTNDLESAMVVTFPTGPTRRSLPGRVDSPGSAWWSFTGFLAYVIFAQSGVENSGVRSSRWRSCPVI